MAITGTVRVPGKRALETHKIAALMSAFGSAHIY
jgi:hypothetical protein